MAAIDTLISERGICISIVVPTIQEAEAKNYEALKKAVQRARGLLQNKAYPEEIKNSLTLKLDEAVRVMPHSVLDGLGIFVSTNQSAVLSFPFPVHPKIKVDDRFEVRDLFNLRQFQAPYYVLTLSSREIRLYSGIMDELKEINDENFPLLLDYQYEFHTLGGTNSTDKSQTTSARKGNRVTALQKSMLSDCDAHLEPYLSRDEVIIIAGGDRKIIDAFRALTRFSNKVIGKISGSLQEGNASVVQRSAWLAYVRYKKNKDEQFIRQLISDDHGHLSEGICDAWKDVHLGKEPLLAVEKDYHCRAYRLADRNTLLLQPPPKPFTILSDAVDELIYAVYRRNGEIVFMENGQLKNLAHVVLILRH